MTKPGRRAANDDGSPGLDEVQRLRLKVRLLRVAAGTVMTLLIVGALLADSVVQRWRRRGAEPPPRQLSLTEATAQYRDALDRSWGPIEGSNAGDALLEAFVARGRRPLEPLPSGRSRPPEPTLVYDVVVVVPRSEPVTVRLEAACDFGAVKLRIVPPQALTDAKLALWGAPGADHETPPWERYERRGGLAERPAAAGEDGRTVTVPAGTFTGRHVRQTSPGGELELWFGDDLPGPWRAVLVGQDRSRRTIELVEVRRRP